MNSSSVTTTQMTVMTQVMVEMLVVIVLNWTAHLTITASASSAAHTQVLMVLASAVHSGVMRRMLVNR